MKPITQQQLEEAIAVLKRGGVVVFPTETAYGLAADATNPKGVQRVCDVKGRTPVSLPIIAGNREMAEGVGHIPRPLVRLADKHWPGPLTLLIPAAHGVLAPGIVSNDQIAVRVSSGEVAKALSEGIGAPIVSTSANVSGGPTGYSIADVQKQFEGREHQPDLYLDAGDLDPSVLPSTIVEFDDYGYPEVVRQGEIEID